MDLLADDMPNMCSTPEAAFDAVTSSCTSTISYSSPHPSSEGEAALTRRDGPLRAQSTPRRWHTDGCNVIDMFPGILNSGPRPWDHGACGDSTPCARQFIIIA
jgi:hypothetical protein